MVSRIFDSFGNAHGQNRQAQHGAFKRRDYRAFRGSRILLRLHLVLRRRIRSARNWKRYFASFNDAALVRMRRSGKTRERGVRGAIHKGAFVVCRPVYRALCGGNSRLMEMDFSDFRGDNNTFWNLALFYRYTGTARARVGLHRKGCGAAFQQDNSRIVFCDCRRCGA